MHKCAVAIFFMCCFAVQANAQWSEASHRQEAYTTFLWQVGSRDTTNIKALFKKGWACLNREYAPERRPDSAIFFFKRALALSDVIRLASFRNESLHCLGEAYLGAGNIDSAMYYFHTLTEIYKSQNDKRGMAKTAYWLGSSTYGRDIDISTRTPWLRIADSLYREAHDTLGQVSAENFLCYDYYLQGKMDSAEQLGLSSLKLCQYIKSPLLYSNYFLLSSINRYKGNLNKALEYAIAAVNRKQLAHDNVELDQYTGTLAMIYQELGQPAQSIEWYRKTIAMRERRPHNPVSVYWTQNLLVKELVKLDKGEEALSESIALAKRNPTPDSLCHAIAAHTLAYCYSALGRYAEAERHYLESLRWYDIITYTENERLKLAGTANPEFVSITQQDFGTFYLEQKRYAEARPHLETALRMSFPFITVPRQIAIHQMLFTVDSAAGDYMEAIKHLQRYQELHDSAFSESKNKQIASLEIQFDTRQKEQNIELLKKGSLLQETKLKQAAFVRNIILLGILVLIVMVVLLFNRYRFKQIANMQLESQQRDLRLLVKEKEWLVKEIHHRVKNNLHIVAGLLDSQAAFLKSDEALEAIHDTQHRVFAMSLIHQKLYQSDRLSVTEMPAYIQEIVAYLETAFNARRRIRFHLDIARVELAISYVVPLGLILNEAITNALKYAFPDGREGNIHIKLMARDSAYFCLEIIDDGIGLPDDFDKYNRESMGMTLMEGLSEEMDGHFTINSKKGTHVEIVFKYTPVEKQGLVINTTEFITENVTV